MRSREFAEQNQWSIERVQSADQRDRAAAANRETSAGRVHLNALEMLHSQRRRSFSFSVSVCAILAFAIPRFQVSILFKRSLLLRLLNIIFYLYISKQNNTSRFFWFFKVVSVLNMVLRKENSYRFWAQRKFVIQFTFDYFHYKFKPYYIYLELVSECSHNLTKFILFAIRV